MSDDLDFLFKPIVLITGFGPYLNHPVNASWEAVKIMNKEAIEKKHNVELVQIELPVTYENVDEFVPALWETHTPKLMIHVGVSGKGQCLQLESQAHRKGYKKKDYLDKLPANWSCLADGAIRLHTKLDVERICKEFNGDNTPEERFRAEVSLDAGRYLCEYIYYTSLSIDNSRTLFVHVPVMDIYSPEETASGLERILDLCLAQINERGDSTDQVTEQLKNTKVVDDNDLQSA
ncbi:pyroglutamyl-peptidase 1 isoform X2 [Spodoptera frugiperda]|uniref:Pyroglutamyl-peptidase 1 isoform X2 n=1 Tax=Spodoptera frugiperda TaxID=7108 RepID=A0A9R0EVA4_SPOFR|nr:pyroglutamyl-peptidase 1 isoform X2 [Spodoptera frugiperda]